MNREELQRIIIAKAWEDENFKRRLLNDPKRVLKEDFDIEFSVNIRILEDTSDVFHFIIPLNPSIMTDEELDSIVGGFNLYD